MSDDEVVTPPPSNIIIMPGTCQCGCGGKIGEGSRWVPGHHLRNNPEALAKMNRFKKGENNNPLGITAPKRPVTNAYRQLMGRPFPGDPEGRTFAQIIALSMAKAAIEGNVAAAKEITDRLEGRVDMNYNINNTTDVNINVDAQIYELTQRLRSQLPQSSGTGDVEPGGQGALPESSSSEGDSEVDG